MRKGFLTPGLIGAVSVSLLLPGCGQTLPTVERSHDARLVGVWDCKLLGLPSGTTAQRVTDTLYADGTGYSDATLTVEAKHQHYEFGLRGTSEWWTEGDQMISRMTDVEVIIPEGLQGNINEDKIVRAAKKLSSERYQIDGDKLFRVDSTRKPFDSVECART